MSPGPGVGQQRASVCSVLLLSLQLTRAQLTHNVGEYRVLSPSTSPHLTSHLTLTPNLTPHPEHLEHLTSPHTLHSHITPHPEHLEHLTSPHLTHNTHT